MTTTETKYTPLEIGQKMELLGYVRSPHGWIRDPKLAEQDKNISDLLKKSLSFKNVPSVADKIEKNLDTIKQCNKTIVKEVSKMQQEMYVEYPEQLGKCKTQEERDVITQDYIYTLNFTISNLCMYIEKMS
jgi:hypothetical protein